MIVEIKLKTDKTKELLRAINQLKLVTKDIEVTYIEDNEK